MVFGLNFVDVYVSVSGPEQDAPLRLRPTVLNTDVNIEETVEQILTTFLTGRSSFYLMAYIRSFTPLVLAHVFFFSFICITKSGLPAVCISGNCSFLVLF